MTIEEAATELMKTYSRFGVDKKELIRMMKNGVRNYDLTVESTFHGLRMVFGEQFGISEVFTQKDIAAMLDVSEEEAVLEIEAAKAQLIEQGEDISQYIISEPQRQKFILSPQKWTS
ncbi:hypothetical protein ACTQ50_18655 [Blautia sp. Sow4_E7]|uniref:hypothetical protein n=1 Tax=Blautia sp. Sow4_E7 TaxID=3438749 RepID=UPI003F8E6ABE